MRNATQLVISNIKEVKECFGVLGFEFNIDRDENKKYQFKIRDNKSGKEYGLYARLFHYDSEVAEEFGVDFTCEDLEYELITFKSFIVNDENVYSLEMKEWNYDGLKKDVSITKNGMESTYLYAKVTNKNNNVPTIIVASKNHLSIENQETKRELLVRSPKEIEYKNVTSDWVQISTCEQGAVININFENYESFRNENVSVDNIINFILSHPNTKKLFDSFEERLSSDMVGCLDYVKKNFPIYEEVKNTTPSYIDVPDTIKCSMGPSIKELRYK